MVTKRAALLGVLLVSLGAGCEAPRAVSAVVEAAGPGASAPAVRWQLVPIPVAQSLRGLAAVDASTAWVGGSKGTLYRTTDGGLTWRDVAPPQSAACDFRDVQAFGRDTALAMVAGEPARIYRTDDGGATWRIVLEDPRPGAFFDGMAFVGDVGVLFGDPLADAFCLFTSRDAGRTWTPVPREQLPAPLAGEASFAASGTSVAATGQPGQERFWIATGGGARARVLLGDGGRWQAVDVPLRAGAASMGGFGLALAGDTVVLVGGDYAAPADERATGARSEDGGQTWQPVALGGFRSAAVWLDDAQVLAVGSHGTSWSGDGGRRWSPVDGPTFHSLARGSDGSVWAAGAEGRVGRLEVAQPTAALQLAPLFGDHMVLPANAVVPFTGSGEPGAQVVVTTPWGPPVSGTVAADGRFRVDVPTIAAAGPHALAVQSRGRTVTLRDVLLGQVWLASGQSNMEMPVGKKSWSAGVRDHEREIAAADLPTLRVFTVEKRAAEQPADAVVGHWSVCSPATAGDCSAVAFFFGRELVRAGQGPVGLVVSAWGGTVAEAWVSETGLAAFPEFSGQLAAQQREGAATQAAQLAAFWQAVEKAPRQPVTSVAVPDRWSQSGLGSFDGVVHYTRTVDVPMALRGRACWLELGALDDMDTTWWNDACIGGLATAGSWSTPRRYALTAVQTAVASGTLRVRVVDTGGEGGFAAASEAVRLVAADDPALVVPLAGPWQRQTGPRLGELPPWPREGGPNRPAVLWNGMLAPLLPFPFTGAIWYQGESNRGRAAQYTKLFPALIDDWRRALGRVLPFYFVQIAPFGYEDDRGEAAELREAQAAALALPQTGMVVTLDCGEAGDIHPVWKQPVGERLAALAMARHPGGGEGPVLREAVRAPDGSVRLAFANTVGLALANQGVGFELADADGGFVPTRAVLAGEQVVLQVPAGLVPTQVRYAWAAVPLWSLRNAAQPAAPFRAAIR